MGVSFQGKWWMTNPLENFIKICIFTLIFFWLTHFLLVPSTNDSLGSTRSVYRFRIWGHHNCGRIVFGVGRGVWVQLGRRFITACVHSNPPLRWTEEPGRRKRCLKPVDSRVPFGGRREEGRQEITPTPTLIFTPSLPKLTHHEDSNQF